MTKEEIKNYVTGLGELNLIDFYNTIACNFNSSDAMIHHNTNQFFRDEFLSLQDAEVSKQSINYKSADKYVVMLEYMELKTSSNLYDLIDLNELVNMVYDCFDEVVKMGIIQFELPNNVFNEFKLNSNTITLKQYRKSFKSDISRLRKVFKGRGKMKGFLFTEICRNDFAVIYEKRNYLMIRFEVFPILININTGAETYPIQRDFDKGTAVDVPTLTDAVNQFYKITKQVKNIN